MKKFVLVASILALTLSGCANLLTPTPPVGPTVDSQATANAQFETAVAATLTAQPTLTATVAPATDTPVPPTDTATLPPTETAVVPPTEAVGTGTATLLPDQTSAAPTGTFNPATATGAPADTAATPTLVTGQVTAIWTLAIRTWGTLPPQVPFGRVTLSNRAKAEAYISLQVTMPDGKFSILEYPVEGNVEIKAPAGSYVYVAWVGGNKLVGSFRLHQDDDLTIILLKDRVVLK